ncbi:aminotransferase class V-fold PLP-dependent enzyme [Lachnospiraceae bacterium HCP1S3_A8]
MIYLDSAATSYHKPDGVARAVAEAISHMGNPGRGAHEASLDASRVVYGTREKMAELFGAEEASQIVFTANSTESLNIAIQGLVDPGDHVITTVMEHNSVLRPLYLCQQQGVSLTILPFSAAGTVTPEAIEAVIRSNTRMIVCTHGSNLTGDLNDLEAIGRVCKKHHLLFVVDASQTAGVFPIQMDSMNIDVLCFTGHKSLMGPQGTGGMCVRKGVRIRPLLVGGSGIDSYSKIHPQVMPTALEAGTLNAHGIAGLSAALDFIKKVTPDVIRQREEELTRRFVSQIKSIPGVKLYGNYEQFPRAPILSLNILDYDSGEIADVLAQDYGIMTRAGAHCAPLMHEALGTKSQGAVRFSFSYFNTEEEIDQAANAIRELAKEAT